MSARKVRLDLTFICRRERFICRRRNAVAVTVKAEFRFSGRRAFIAPRCTDRNTSETWGSARLFLFAGRGVVAIKLASVARCVGGQVRSRGKEKEAPIWGGFNGSSVRRVPVCGVLQVEFAGFML